MLPLDRLSNFRAYAFDSSEMRLQEGARRMKSKSADSIAGITKSQEKPTIVSGLPRTKYDDEIGTNVRGKHIERKYAPSELAIDPAVYFHDSD